MKTILQHDARDCGAACLAMIAGYYGLKMPISHYRELTKTDRNGTNLFGLVQGAEKIGLKAEGLSGTPEELMEGIQKGEIRFPFIAHIVSEEMMLHYVVIYGQKNDTFLIADPGKGNQKLSLSSFFDLWTGYIATFEKTEAFQKENRKKGSFLKFFALLKGQYGKLTGVLVISLIVAGIGIFGSFVFELIMDNFSVGTVSNQAKTPIGGLLSNLSVHMSDYSIVFVALILLYLLQAGIQFIRSYLIASISRKIDLRLTLSYYNHVMDLPVSSLNLRQTGEYLARFSDSASIRMAVSTATLTLLLDSVMVVACGVILYLENRNLFFISLVIAVIYVCIVLIYRKPVEKSNRQVMENNAILQSYFKESIDGAETVKASCAGEKVKQKTSEKFKRFVNAIFRNSLLSSSQDILAVTVELIGTVVILWFGFGMVSRGELTIGSLITFYALLAYFIEPIKNLIALQPTVQAAFVAADRLNDILDLEKEEYQTDALPLSQILNWTFHGVDFRYGNRELTLHGIDLTLFRGQKIGIVGESGSGKTTLARLLLRFYEPEQGEILLDGNRIQDFDLLSLRRSIAYVDQNTFLFSDSIRNNLLLGTAGVTEEEMTAACCASCAHDFIMEFPLGYDMPIEENGNNLSGGQRQRLAIARALLKKPQLLILDEATSNLDTITEEGIRHTIFEFDQNITYIIIAHRLSTVQNCDCIYVMDHGSIAESGTHEELLQSKGMYYRFWEKSYPNRAVECP